MIYAGGHRSWSDIGDTPAKEAGSHNRGDSLWQSMFASTADVLEHSLWLDGARYRVIGVMQPEFEYPLRSDLAYGNPHIKATQLGFLSHSLPSRKQTVAQEPM